MFRLLLVLYLSVLLSTQVESSKILGIFPWAAHSHYILGETLMNELANRGHDVTFLNPYKHPKDAKYKSVELTGFPEYFEEIKKDRDLFNIPKCPFLGTLMMQGMGAGITDKVLSHPNVKKLIDSKEKFDVIIIEQFINDAMKGFCSHFKAPCIIANPLPTNYYANELTGNPSNPSYIPEFMMDLPTPMNFWARFKNALIAFVTRIIYYLKYIPQQDALMHKHFPDAPPLQELMNNISMIFINSHISNRPPVPLQPNMIEIAGFHIKPPKKLPDDLQKYLDDAKEGAIIFGLGSNLKSKDLPQSTKTTILNVLGKLKHKVLWKFEEDLPGKPDNVKILKWMPQQDLLAHPNVILFITHGGLFSTLEAMYHGKPVLGIPVFGDQKDNMKLAELEGYGVMCEYSKFSEECFASALNKLLSNKSYTENAKYRSKLMHDRPMKPIDTAIFWTEYVIRHKGAPHFRSAALNLHWWEYFLLDVVAFIATAAFIFIAILIYLCKLCCGDKKTEKVSKNKKNK